MNDSRRPRLLILSFSRIEADGRVLRQVKEFVRDFEVTTCGLGGTPHPLVAEHIELVGRKQGISRHLRGVLLNLKLFLVVYWLSPLARESRAKLRGRQFDAVVVDDIPALGTLPPAIQRRQVLLDLHEYWPGIQDNDPDWRRLYRPYYTWQLRYFGRNASQFTTVNDVLARLYKENFSFACT